MVEGLTKDWHGGSYIVLSIKPIVPGEIPLRAIGYKYNSWKVLSFVDTLGLGSTTVGITYLSKYPDQFLMSQFYLLLSPLSRQSVLVRVMRSTNTTSHDGRIMHRRSSG